MGRLDILIANNPWKSFMDGFGNSLGYFPLIVVPSLENYLGREHYLDIQ